ncbi:MAG: PDZ domain-containing protein, partial [Caldimonas sp.]
KTAARRTPERDGTKPAAPTSTLGLAVSDLTDAQKRELKIKNGVRVETAEGMAARAGIREGDVIVTIDNVEVTSAKQFDAAVAKLDKAKPVTLLVRRGEAATFLILRPVR